MVTYASFNDIFHEKNLIAFPYSSRLHQLVKDENFTKKIVRASLIKK